MTTIPEQLKAYRADLAQAQANGDQAIARKLEQQLSELEAFQHDDVEAPSALEVFCDLNPSSIECRVYDD